MEAGELGRIRKRSFLFSLPLFLLLLLLFSLSSCFLLSSSLQHLFFLSLSLSHIKSSFTQLLCFFFYLFFSKFIFLVISLFISFSFFSVDYMLILYFLSLISFHPLLHCFFSYPFHSLSNSSSLSLSLSLSISLPLSISLYLSLSYFLLSLPFFPLPLILLDELMDVNKIKLTERYGECEIDRSLNR
ncbi:unnamed protein product [Acanthosepion pharaonis]|uniref:Uncharacterized protein n=1 Tax=Acanthosepion pharaonis TaxID=158019 RepID=A0A812BNH6_ACAPH|nr:unnamed protein product [Sepia pharaonis]